MDGDGFMQRAVRFLRRGGEQIVVPLFFIVLLFIGLRSVSSFGIPYDEGTLDSLGKSAYDYVFHGASWPTSGENRFHGPLVEFLTYTFLHIIGPLDSSWNAWIRHCIVFLSFCGGVGAFYCLAKRAVRDWKLALLGCALLVLSPRIFAHAFYNSRDIPNLALFTTGILTLVRFLERPTRKRAALHGLVCAAAIAVRITAILLPALTLLFLLVRILDRRITWRPVLLPVVIYLGTLTLCTYAFWPLLWAHPIRHLLDAFRFMSSLQADVFYLGRVYHSTPWHYAFVWIFITTPLATTALFLVGMGAATVQALRHPLSSLRDRELVFLSLIWFFLPILSVIVTGAGIYQEWRHLFFIYPAFLLLALSGLHGILGLFRTARLRLAALLIVGVIPALLTAFWMVRNHPYHYVYFSVPSRFVGKNFDRDYWGLSYRQALQFIVERDRRPLVTIHSPDNIAYVNAAVLFPKDRSRMLSVKPEYAYYLLVTHNPSRANPFTGRPELFSVVVDGMKIVSVYEGEGKSNEEGKLLL